jgi:hypothetical protein
MTKLESTTGGSTDPTRIDTADGANHSHDGFDPIKARAINLGSIGVFVLLFYCNSTSRVKGSQPVGANGFVWCAIWFCEPAPIWWRIGPARSERSPAIG